MRGHACGDEQAQPAASAVVPSTELPPHAGKQMVTDEDSTERQLKLCRLEAKLEEKARALESVKLHLMQQSLQLSQSQEAFEVRSAPL
jgi:hypothetical protein